MRSRFIYSFMAIPLTQMINLKEFLSPIPCSVTFVINQMSMHMWAYEFISGLYSVLLLYLSRLLKRPSYLNVVLWVLLSDIVNPSTLLLFRIVSAVLRFLHLFINFRVSLSIFTKKTMWRDLNWLNYIYNSVAENWHLYNIECSCPQT